MLGIWKNVNTNQICDTDHANSFVQSEDFVCIIAQDTCVYHAGEHDYQVLNKLVEVMKVKGRHTGAANIKDIQIFLQFHSNCYADNLVCNEIYIYIYIYIYIEHAK